MQSAKRNCEYVDLKTKKHREIIKKGNRRRNEDIHKRRERK